ncbi:unnamed protein product [Umbelopsis sp. WA50703]
MPVPPHMQQYYPMPQQNEYSSPQLPPPLVVQSQPTQHQQQYARPQYVQDPSLAIAHSNGSPVPTGLYSDLSGKQMNPANKSPYMSANSAAHPTGRPQLRVQIPSEEKENPASISPPTLQSHSTNAAQDSNEQNPPSALPSQFAQNLPSPSTFYPEFYQQNELPSPINYGTPNSAKSFQWPSAPMPTQLREYRPSPLARPETMSQKHALDMSSEEMSGAKRNRMG